MSQHALPRENEAEYLPHASADGTQEGDYVPDAADFIPAPVKQKSPLNRVPGPGTARPALLMFVLFWVASLTYWFGGRGVGGWVSGEAVFQKGEYWRLFTALFTHSDVGHLLSNTPLFLIFGWFLGAFFGPVVFPATVILVGAASNLATVYMYDPGTHLVGASGMLYGMIALWLVLYVHFDTDYSITMRIFRALGVSLLMLFPTTFQETTSYQAHAWGFLFGGVAGLLLCPFVKVIEPPGAKPAHVSSTPEAPESPAAPGTWLH